MSKRSVLAWSVEAVVLASPPLHGWIHAVMPRLLLLEVPAWLALGWLVGRGRQRALRPFNPHGLTGLVFFLGALGFWMIPRSVDWVSTSVSADWIMHATLLGAGAALAASLPTMPFVLRGALGIYGASMTFALGMIYSGYSALLCGTFDLAQQKDTGHVLLAACPVVALLVIGAGARALARSPRSSARRRGGDEARAPCEDGAHG